MMLTLVSQAEVEETLKRIQSQNGVQGIIIVNSEGKNIKIYLTYWCFSLCFSTEALQIVICDTHYLFTSNNTTHFCLFTSHNTLITLRALITTLTTPSLNIYSITSVLWLLPLCLFPILFTYSDYAIMSSANYLYN